MFTGIVEELGKIQKIEGGSNCKLTISAKKILEDIKLGDSIAVNGICLTVVKFTSSSFTVDIMMETWKRTSLYKLNPGSPVNLERAMPANGRFGGHIVSGHIDGTGEIVSIRQDGNAVWYRIKTSKNIMKFIIQKGSIAIDGISLTVAEAGNADFYVSVIPHTLSNTVLATRHPGDIVNLENDIVGKYIESFTKKSENSKLCENFLPGNWF
ncbi:riboflavin synthase [Johnsonella ignava]|uniref:riboflavin synthase n=1 Tax=Johnsonella ignava TaxID=43995 RepID=UPI0023F310AB|nr:riboflavin synthase [Johnsonella ignava]